MKYLAYCVTCNREVCKPIPNGSMVTTMGKMHLTKGYDEEINPIDITSNCKDHKVIIGYYLDIKKD